MIITFDALKSNEIRLTKAEAKEIVSDLLAAIEEADRGVQVENINITDQKESQEAMLMSEQEVKDLRLFFDDFEVLTIEHLKAHILLYCEENGIEKQEHFHLRID